MDPNAILQQLREWSVDPHDEADHRRVGYAEAMEEATHVAELIQDLDHWLSNGGLLPDDWQRNRRAALSRAFLDGIEVGEGSLKYDYHEIEYP